MKKIAVCLTLSCMIISTLCSCSNKTDAESNVLESNDSKSVSSISDEEYAKQLANENYIKIPKDGGKALDKALSFAKVTFADENAEKLMCGYKGEKSIDNENYCVFEVYAQKEEGLNKLGILAVSKNGNAVSVYDDNTNKFVSIK
ncbi:MAG: hypothetical protein ACI4RN_04655 [Oscillospiraceae bacterium]